ncbi:hypothetical protein DQ04_00311230 [Trypanosoma grayi]|uniref:hypothetical protein n=1 Tax=Trypanosoma grayi TaxID=71804 RepID=UPI0004F416A4|nr:hypothetical protein DQ04_00311230 [Trypanosoma grayi]KEG14787.1 hypothetical protein DQ04_00311230 [Trypanosoma grayi]
MVKTTKRREESATAVQKQSKKTTRATTTAAASSGGHSPYKKHHHQQQQSSPQQQQQSKKSEALRAALATAFSAPTTRVDDASAADEYGKGSPTDRLQFGYAPAIAAEAVAFHTAIPAKKWVADRRSQGRITFVKKQKLTRPNCEPMTSLLKLKEHWRSTAQFVAEVRGGDVGQDTADDLLEMLVSRQRVA